MKKYSLYYGLLVFLLYLLGCGKGAGVNKEKVAENQLISVTGYIELDIVKCISIGSQPSVDESVRRIRSKKGDDTFTCWLDPTQMVCINPSTKVWLDYVNNSKVSDYTNINDILAYIPVPLTGINATSQYYLGYVLASPEFIKLDKRPAWAPLSIK